MSLSFLRSQQRVVRGAHQAARQLLSSSRLAAPASLLSTRSPLAAVSSFSPLPLLRTSAASFHSRSSTFAAPTPLATPGSVIDFNLADIGEGIAECEVLRWFIAEGDTIAQFDKVCEVQSDKANVEITSRYDGKILSLKYAVGELAKVGKPLLTIQLAGSADPAVPGVGSIDTAAPDMQEPSPAIAGRPGLAQQIAQGGGQGSSYLHEQAEEAIHAANEKVLTSPAVRRIAREEKVALAQVKGTGPAGRILKEDVMTYIRGGRKSMNAAPVAPVVVAAAAPVKAAAAGAAAPAAKVFAEPSQYLTQDKVIPITGLNRIMVQTMTAANAVPQLGYSDEILMDNLWEMRGMLNKESVAKYGIKISFMPFILKATSLALKQYPQLNAHTNSDCTSLTHKSMHNLGLAMDTPRGLLVPNVKDVASKSILDIARDMSRLSKLGQDGKLGREELTGGTFTISNIGTIGGTYMSPIIVLPEVVIGALGAIQTLPRYTDPAFTIVKPTRIMNVSWSADHRVVDGATMARFSNLWKYYLENPAAMMLDTK